MEKLDFYKCEICGNLVQVILNSYGELVCCGQPMKKLVAQNSEEAMMEKHIPVFVKLDNGNEEIRVGEVLHPMINEHYIMFVETVSEDKNYVQLQYLYPGQEPKMTLKENSNVATAYELCNIHGLWEGKK